ncbi:MAG: GGDEF domain-containing protein [Lachnospiraceae bacterium]|nr:GGDEF domain-containing protein [Lachnospiraceae bacterium]
MELTSAQEEIIKLKDEINEIRFNDPKRVIELAHQVLALDEADEEHPEHGFAMFSIGDAYYTMGDSDKCLQYINHAVVEFHRTADWEKLGECFNLMGIMFSHQGNMANALDSYYAGINLAETYHLDFLGAMIYQNFAELCDRTNNVEEALRKAYQSQEYINRLTHHHRRDELYMANQVSIIKANLKLHQLETAEDHHEDLQDFLLAHPEYQDDLDVLLMEMLLAKEQGRLGASLDLLDKAYQAFMKYPYGIDFFWEGFELMEQMEEHGMEEQLEVIISHIKHGVQGDGFPDLLMRLSKFRIDLLTRQGNQQGLLEELKVYCGYVDMQTKQNYRNMYQFIELQDSLKQSNQQNALLQQRAETDELTAIANRRRLNEVSDHFFENAMSTKKNFGVEMLDIDKFKLVNDQFGHIVGDACLVALADVLRTVQNEHVFVARYGGDEFFILFLGLSRDEISAICQKIAKTMSEVIVDRNLPQFTISQGVCERIPLGPNKLWDFTSLADLALYESKRRGGNTTIIVQNSQELKQISLKGSEKR